MVVDDNPQHLLALEVILNELGRHIFFVSSADEALYQLLENDFAVILLDVHMPLMNGFELASLIRNRQKSRDTPIIFLTAVNKDDVDINRGYKMGAVDYVFKPIDPDILRTKVKIFIELFNKSFRLHNELKKRKHAEMRLQSHQRQRAILEMNRLNTIEEITSATAHEINQPITAVKSYLIGCINRLSNKQYQIDEIISKLQHATKQIDRAGAILHRINNFVRKNKSYYKMLEINSLIINIQSLLKDTMDESGIKLILNLTSQEIPKISFDQMQIEQVLLNLLINSMQALQEVRRVKKVIIIETLLDKEYLVIRIKDNGPGIVPEDIDKLFDLYFSTKPKGMGIGLSICRSIVEAHGGNISATNNKNRGACFEMLLPIKTIKK